MSTWWKYATVAALLAVALVSATVLVSHESTHSGTPLARSLTGAPHGSQAAAPATGAARADSAGSAGSAANATSVAAGLLDAPTAVVGELDAGGDATPVASAHPATRAAATAAAQAATAGATASASAGSRGEATSRAPAAVASHDEPSGAIARLLAPAAGIDAPVVLGGVDANTHLMVAPRGPWVVAWYGYSAVPGQGGNAVFAGHVDYVNVGEAVFWNLRDLQPGDRIAVQLADGRTLDYRVQFNRVYGASSGPWTTLFSPSAGNDVITLYTCDGTFHDGEYSSRRVVRAVRDG